GKIRTRSYDDPNGVKRYVTEIFADNMEMLSVKSNGQSGTYAPQSTSAAPQQASAPAASVASQSNPADDLPF
ncbi:MAG: single-stranded DNA-binding protein, partial [Rikenellaceae bacterium]